MRRSSVDRAITRATRAVDRAAAGDGPVLAGPFTGEVGFEILYWIPFLRWAVDRRPELLGRLLVVSRGGTRGWYGGLAGRYIDLFDLLSYETVARRRASLKQASGGELDQQVLDRLGMSRPALLHPELLYGIYGAARASDPWAFVHAVELDDQLCARGLAALYTPMSKPEDPPDPAPGPGHVALRFYVRPSFPDTPATREFVATVGDVVATTTEAVLLCQPFAVDEHVDLPLAGRSYEHAMRPATNLAVQTALLYGADAFVGTYGGLAYVAQALGIPAITFSVHPEHTHPWHQALATRLATLAGWGALTVGRPSELGLLRVGRPGVGMGQRV